MNENNENTTFSNKCVILSELWLTYRNDEEFEDFINYNDLGLPLAYAIGNGIVAETDRAKNFIEEAWALLLAGMDLEDTGFESLDELLSAGSQ